MGASSSQQTVLCGEAADLSAFMPLRKGTLVRLFHLAMASRFGTHAAL